MKSYQDKYGYYKNLKDIENYINNCCSAKVIKVIKQPENKMCIFICHNYKKVMTSIKYPWLWHAFYLPKIKRWRLITFDKEHMCGLHNPKNMELWYTCSRDHDKKCKTIY